MKAVQGPVGRGRVPIIEFAGPTGATTEIAITG